MLKILLKKQFAEIFRSYFYDAKKGKARSKAAVALYVILFAFIMVVFLGGVFTFVSFAICSALSLVDMDWLYFSIMGLIAILLGAFGSVFNTYSGLYLAKDNDLLLSMPIPVSAIIASRLLGVYLMGLMYSGVVIIPAVIVYWCVVSSSVGAIIGGVLLVLLISLFVMTLSCALGWIVAKISLKLKNKSFITVIISLLFMCGYYLVCFKAQTIIEQLISNAVLYGSKIKASAYPIYLLGQVGSGDAFAMASVSAFVLILFALVCILIARSFLKLATSSGAVAKKKQSRAIILKQSSIDAALLKKEFRRFTSSSVYMLNCGLGILLLILCGILLVVKGGALAQITADAIDGIIPAMFCALICMIASMNDMATPSVSLEGKSIWLLQSLPVTPWQVLRAKLSLQIILTILPVLICFVCTAIVYPYTAIQVILVLLVLVLYVLFSAMFGLYLGLKSPNLRYTSEVTPIKQSLNVAIALFSGMIYAGLLFVGYMFLGEKMGFNLYMVCFAIITILLTAMLYLWLKNKGTKVFSSL